jgi:ATP-dependent Lon protease
MTLSYNLRNKNATNKKDAEKKAEKEKMMKHQKLKKSTPDDGDGDIEFEFETEDDSDDYETEYETEDENDSDNDAGDEDSETEEQEDGSDEEEEEDDDESSEEEESDEHSEPVGNKRGKKSAKSKKDQSFDELLASIFPSNYTREKAKKGIKSKENTESTESLVKRALGLGEKENGKHKKTKTKSEEIEKRGKTKSEETEKRGKTKSGKTDKRGKSENSKKCNHDYGEEDDEDLIDDIIRHMKAKNDKKAKKAKNNKNQKKNRDSDVEDSDAEEEEDSNSDNSVTNDDDDEEEEEDEDYTPPKEGKKTSKSTANDNIFMTITYDDDYYDETENIEEVLYADTECNSEDEKTFMSDVYEKVNVPLLDNAEKSNDNAKNKTKNNKGKDTKDKNRNKDDTKEKTNTKGKDKDNNKSNGKNKDEEKPKKESNIQKLLKCLKETNQTTNQIQNTNQANEKATNQNQTQPTEQIANQANEKETNQATEGQIHPPPTEEQSKKTTTSTKGKKKTDKDETAKDSIAKINADTENEYKDLVLLKKQLAEKLEAKPNSKILANAIKECDKEIKDLILKTRRKNTEEYYNLSNTKPKHTGEFEYFKKKLSHKEQVKIMQDLTVVNEHIQVLKPYKLTLLQSNIPAKYKATVMQKLNMLQSMEPGDSEYHKLKMWIDTFMRIPFNVYKDLSISIKDGLEVCNNFMNNAKKTLDECTYGLDDAKMQILQLVGQWITNPNAMGTAIAIYGPKGTGKTSLSKEGISKIFGREFTFISLGGSGDSSYLEGHSYTYEGSSWGKIAQILIESKCMNPIIYFDELDKISDSPRGQEITGILTHLTDTTQNTQFKDKFFSEVDLDLSRCLFIFSYNDENAVNPILRDRMYRIQTKGYDVKEKTIIAKKYLLPKIREQVNFKEGDIVIPDEVIQYIISNESMTQKEEGVRNLKRCLEIIHTKLNLFRLMHSTDENSILGKNIQLKVSFPHTVTRAEVDILIKNEEKQNQSLLAMYV